jgi:hypothetical protein
LLLHLFAGAITDFAEPRNSRRGLAGIMGHTGG